MSCHACCAAHLALAGQHERPRVHELAERRRQRAGAAARRLHLRRGRGCGGGRAGRQRILKLCVHLRQQGAAPL